MLLSHTMSALKEKFFSVVSCYGQQLGLKTVDVCYILDICVSVLLKSVTGQ